MVPLDNPTRWNSWFLILDVVIKYEGAVDSYNKKYFSILQEDYLTLQDWVNLRRIMEFL